MQNKNATRQLHGTHTRNDVCDKSSEDLIRIFKILIVLDQYLGD